MTHRERLGWDVFLDELQWEHPNQLIFYLMQCAAETFRPNAKNPNDVAVDGFKLRFVREPAETNEDEELEEDGLQEPLNAFSRFEQPKPLTKEDIRRLQGDMAEARWRAGLAKVKKPES